MLFIPCSYLLNPSNRPKTSVPIGPIVVSAHDSGSGDSDLLKSAISGLCARTAGDTAGGVLPRRNWDHDQWIQGKSTGKHSHRVFYMFLSYFFLWNQCWESNSPKLRPVCPNTVHRAVVLGAFLGQHVTNLANRKKMDNLYIYIYIIYIIY